MSPAALKILASLITAIVLSIAVTLATNHYMHLRDAAAQNEQQKEKSAATTEILQRGDASTEQRFKLEVDVGEARGQYNQSKQEEYRHDPLAVDRDNAPVPSSVRERARQRRLIRERSSSSVE